VRGQGGVKAALPASKVWVQTGGQQTSQRAVDCSPDVLPLPLSRCSPAVLNWLESVPGWPLPTSRKPTGRRGQGQQAPSVSFHESAAARVRGRRRRRSRPPPAHLLRWSAACRRPRSCCRAGRCQSPSGSATSCRPCVTAAQGRRAPSISPAARAWRSLQCASPARPAGSPVACVGVEMACLPRRLARVVANKNEPQRRPGAELGAQAPRRAAGSSGSGSGLLLAPLARGARRAGWGGLAGRAGRGAPAAPPLARAGCRACWCWCCGRRCCSAGLARSRWRLRRPAIGKGLQGRHSAIRGGRGHRPPLAAAGPPAGAPQTGWPCAGARAGGRPGQTLVTRRGRRVGRAPGLAGACARSSACNTALGGGEV
jgi:hypothetical protein